MVTRLQETQEQALSRLASKARAEGVKLLQSVSSGQYFATSTSQPGKRYRVSADHCECLGFQSHGRCKHHAALLSALTGTGAPCSECKGQGSIPRMELFKGKRVDIYVPCHACKGTGVA